MSFSRRRFMTHLGLAAAGLTAAASRSSGARATAPNIVLILADDLGYGHLECYGQKRIRTPHINRLAGEGVRFTQAYSGCSVCAPSRSVLLTGKHAGHASVRDNEGGVPLQADERTLAHALQEAGYRTGLFGKWGLGDANTNSVPNRMGFDEFYGYLHQRHAQFYYTDYLWRNQERILLDGNRDGKREQYTHDLILERGLDFIRESQARPFFCFFSFTIPHHEWAVPVESLREYQGKFPETPQAFRWREGYAQPKEPKATMAAMISHLDKSVGRILDLLQDLGLRRNTLVLFASDNGGADYELACAEFFEANGPLKGYKGSLQEGGIRVPAIASLPGVLATGADSDSIWHFADLLPTFVALAGRREAIPQDCDGLSQWSAWISPPGEGPSPIRQDKLYWEIGLGEPRRAARWREWKAIWNACDDPIELYNLVSDPGETSNVASDHPEIVESLRGFMTASHQPPPPQIEPDKPDSRFYY